MYPSDTFHYLLKVSSKNDFFFFFGTQGLKYQNIWSVSNIMLYTTVQNSFSVWTTFCRGKKNSLKKNIWGQNFIFCEVFLYCLFLQKLYWDFHFHISEWSISSPLFCLGFIQSTSAKLEKSLIRKKMNWQTHKGLVYPFYYSNPHHIELASAFKIRQRIAIPSKRSSNQYLSTAHWHDCTREKPIHLISIVINILRMDYLQMWEEWW